MNKPSLEELLKIASEGTEEIQNNTIFFSPIVEEFIKEYSIAPGEFFYPTYVIYYLFEVEFKYHVKNKPSKIELCRQLNKIVQPYRNGKQRYYKLKEIPQVDKEVILRAKKFKNREKNEKKNQKVQL
jgi:hypothetical protein